MSDLIPYITLFSIWVFQLAYWLIIVWVVASWLILFGVMSPSSGLWRALSNAVEPIIRPFRWARIGMIDLSPIVAIFALEFLVGIMMKYMAAA